MTSYLYQVPCIDREWSWGLLHVSLMDHGPQMSNARWTSRHDFMGSLYVHRAI